MKIQTNVLKGLIAIKAGRSAGRHLQSLRVSNDGQWLVAANGTSLGMGRIIDGEGLSGHSFSGSGLETIAVEASRHKTPSITLHLSPGPMGVVWWDSHGGELRSADRGIIYPLPPTENLIASYPLNRTNGEAGVIPGAHFTRAAKAVGRLGNVFVFPNKSGTWFVSGRDELRVLVLCAYVPAESWPQS